VRAHGLDRDIARRIGRACFVERLAAQHPYRTEHRARVRGRRAAAATDEAHAALQHAPREHAEVLGVRDV
jgi:hypothetical protein